MYTVLRDSWLDSMAFEKYQTATTYGETGFYRSTSGCDAKSDQTDLWFSEDTDHSRRILITDKEDVMAALSAGAIAVSSTNHQVWKM